MLALMIADITNPVFFDAVRGAERAASERGYITVLAESQESSINEAAAIERILPAVDGVVFVTSRLSENEIREMSLTKPVVLMNRKVQDVENVVPNFEPGVCEAVEHLMSNHRWELILDHAVSMGLNVVQIGPASPTVEGGRGALKLVRAAGVSAVITYNDVMAIGLVKQAQEEGLNIPEDLSVVGIDDIFAAGLSTPGLTTIKTPLAETGELAVKSLLGILDDVPLSTNSQILTTNLVVRGTTAKIGN
jgi:LacI family transcriptional regulator